MIGRALVLILLGGGIGIAAEPVAEALDLLRAAAEEAEKAVTSSTTPWITYWNDADVQRLHAQIALNRPGDDAQVTDEAEMAALQLLGLQSSSASAQALAAAERSVETARASALEADATQLRSLRGEVQAVRTLQAARTSQGNRVVELRARVAKLPAPRSGPMGERNAYVQDALVSAERALVALDRQIAAEQDILAKHHPGGDPLAEAAVISDRAEQDLKRIAVAVAVVDRYASGLHAGSGWPTLTMASSDGALTNLNSGDPLWSTSTVELRDPVTVSTGSGTATVRWPDGSLADLGAGVELIVHPSDHAKPINLKAGVMRITGSLPVQISGGTVVTTVGQAVFVVGADATFQGLLAPGSSLLVSGGSIGIPASAAVRIWHAHEGLITNEVSSKASWDAWQAQLAACP